MRYIPKKEAASTFVKYLSEASASGRYFGVGVGIVSVTRRYYIRILGGVLGVLIISIGDA